MEYTEEQKKDFEERAQAFQAEFDLFYKDLKAKHECEFIYAVSTVPSPSGVFGLGVNQNVGDTKYKSVPSPEEFVAKEK